MDLIAVAILLSALMTLTAQIPILVFMESAPIVQEIKVTNVVDSSVIMIGNALLILVLTHHANLVEAQMETFVIVYTALMTVNVYQTHV